MLKSIIQKLDTIIAICINSLSDCRRGQGEDNSVFIGLCPLLIDKGGVVACPFPRVAPAVIPIQLFQSINKNIRNNYPLIPQH